MAIIVFFLKKFYLRETGNSFLKIPGFGSCSGFLKNIKIKKKLKIYSILYQIPIVFFSKKHCLHTLY